MTFSFKDVFTSIDEALQEIEVVIFKMSQEPPEWVQPDWSTQLCHVLECYNVIAKGENDDPRNINISEVEGHHEVEGPQLDNPNITSPLKTKQVNIRIEAKPKFEKIRDYWDDATVDKVAKLLRKYQDLFPTNFSDLKGIVGNLGVMKITLKPDMNPIK